ncbi:MAG: hypothetical protein IKV21_00750 [Clostridia bacterium]|nr:hypothetical protein [Clostridia bacterium]
MKKIISVILALSVVLCSFAFCASAAEGKQYRDYKVYTLLGDSVASGYDDVEKNSSSCQFKYKENGYGARVAKALGIEKFNSMACPAVRTVEVRYLLEDDYPMDDYMFYGIGYDWQREGFKEEYRNAIREADIITLGIGGNDYLTYCAWHVFEEMEKEGLGVHKELADAIINLVNETGINESTLGTIIDVASVMDALPEIVQILPGVFANALEDYYENWNHVIEDIYSYNEDVELYVIGGLNYGVILPGGDDVTTLKYNIGLAVAELGNKPQIEGAEKYGYTFVSTKGTPCKLTHPTPEGYGLIAEKILEALPDARYCYDDVPYGSEYYNAVYYMYKNGYMSGISATEFGAGEKFTAGQLAEALCSISGQTQADAYSWAVEKGLVKADADSELGYFDVMTSLNSFSAHQGKTDFFYRLRLIVFTVKNMFSKLIFGSVKRGDAAKLIYGYCEL